MEEKYNLNSISKAFEKLFKAGFNTSKKIATLDIKEVRKIPNLTMSDFYSSAASDVYKRQVIKRKEMMANEKV